MPAHDRTVAIVGIGCRFPGAAGPDAFWQLLESGTDAIAEVPPERPVGTRWAGLIDGVDLFDAEFFGIAPREADRMDPQQRLALEVAWEALEHAGLPRGRLAGEPVGVFMGVSTYDYSRLPFRAEDVDVYSGTGNALSIVANRLSYVLDARGPSVAVDTACSSSLVAVHLACESLRSGESDVALAGGVNALLSPDLSISLAAGRMMAADGRCKTFDARADGYVRGEGCGIVVLKRAADALRDGDRIVALIRGTAVNQDGRSNGLTAPNGPSQEAVVRDALRRAGVEPAAVDYVEAHGTGTALGDPIEALALDAVLRPGRTRPALVGSVKTNIGHLEAAAGVAGLIKAALAVQHRRVPPSLHFEHANPQIPFEDLCLRVPVAAEDWPEGEGVAAVSSFGFGGTNAHAVLAAPPAVETASAPARSASLLPLSARDPEALAALVAGAPEPAPDVCWTAGVRRTHHDHRAAIVGGAAVTGTRLRRPRTAFVFSGQGPALDRVGLALAAEEPVFRVRLEEAGEILRALGGPSPLDELAGPRLHEAEVAQPVLASLQIALASLWASWGIAPAAVAGHSVGEIAAAQAAGVLTLEDALRLALCRGRALAPLAGTGSLLAVAALPDPLPADIELAAHNGPSAFVLTGPPDAIAELHDRLRGETRTRLLHVDGAYHSVRVEALQDDLRAALAWLQPRRASLPLFSTLTGARVEGPELDAGYWARQARSTVRFADAAQALLATGVTDVVEIGPHGTLLVPLAELGGAVGLHASLRRDAPELEQLYRSLGGLYVRGHEIDWRAVHGERGRLADLPRYPWQRRRHWIPERQGPAAPSGPPLVPVRLRTAAPVYETWLTRDAVAPHLIGSVEVVPLTCGVAVAAAAARAERGDVALRDLRVERALPMSESLRLQASFALDTLTLAASADDGASWQTWLTAAVGDAPPPHVADGTERPVDDLDAALALLAGNGVPFAIDLAVVRDGAPASARVHAGGLSLFDAAGAEVVRLAGIRYAKDAAPTYRVEWEELPPLAGDLRLVAPAVEAADGFDTTALCAGYAARALAELGDAPVPPRHARLVGRLRALAPLPAVANEGDTPELALLDRCGRSLAGVIRGELDPLEILFADDLVERVYRESPVARAANAAAADAVRQLCGTPLDVLELGGGTGGLTGALLEALPAGSSYLFTDVSAQFLAPARERFGVETAVVDVERLDPNAPTHDVVVAANVLHATRDLHETLANVQRLLRRGGALVLVEQTSDDPALDLTFGLTDGWWRFDDAIRTTSPLVAADTWRSLLEQSGFEDVVATPTGGGMTLLLARAAGAATRRVYVCPRTDDVEEACRPLLDLMPTLDAPLWIVTRGAERAPAQAALWGLARTLAVERPELFGGIVDAETTDEALAELDAPGAERQVAIVDGVRRAPRLRPHPLPPAPFALRDDATYLVTGGLGALGLLTAEWLVECGARRLVLAGRSAAPTDAVARLGVPVDVVQADVTSRDDVERLVDRCGPALAGVVHAAGVTDDAPLADMDWPRFERVLGAKAIGAQHLDEATRRLALDFFVLFSSAASVVGMPGVGNYAAANAFVDALAARRRAAGLPALAVRFSTWAVGMGEAVGAERQRLWAAAGARPLEPRAALAALGRALAAGETDVAVIDADWDAVAGRSAQSVLRSLVNAPLRATSEAPVSADRRSLVALVQRTVADVLALDAGRSVEVDRGLHDLGMDSLTALELRNRLQRATALELPATLAFERPTVAALADHLLELLAPAVREPMVEEPVRPGTDLERILAGVAGAGDDDLLPALMHREPTL